MVLCSPLGLNYLLVYIMGYYAEVTISNERRTKNMKCEIEIVKCKGKDNKVYDNLYLTTPKGIRVQVKLAFYNIKLAYKIKKEIEG